jgi:manganese efflux pump family protein
MKAIIILGILTGLDNLFVTPGVGLLNISRGRRHALALAFGLFEALMPLAGLFLGAQIRLAYASTAEFIGPVVLLFCGAVILFMSLKERDLEPVLSSRWTLVGFPLSLSFDNFLAGLGVGTAGASLLMSAVTIGGISAVMCMFGLYAGQWLRRFVPRNAEVLSGIYLMFLGITGFFWRPFA